jgi:tRNA (cytidine/uridine-2'-O-)-methyltransferase
MRLCVNTGNRLHLIRPLGFDLDDARLRRAGLDYREYADVLVHDNLVAFLAAIQPRRLFAYTQHAERLYTSVAYRDGDALLFGRESDGLPSDVLNHRAVSDRLRIPIAPGGRSLNLANAAAVVVYEAWRQADFA